MTNRKKIGRNDPCPCGSKKKYKKCCLETSFNKKDQQWYIDFVKTTSNCDLKIYLKEIERLSTECVFGYKDIGGEFVGSFYLAFLAINYVANNDLSKKQRPFVPKDFLNAFHLAKKIPYPNFEKEIKERSFRYFIKSRYLQFPYTIPPINLFGRGLIFYKYYEKYHCLDGFDIKKTFEEIYGLDIDTFIFLGFSFFTVSYTNKNFDVQKVLETKVEKFKKYVTKENVEKFLSIVSKNPKELKKIFLDDYDKRNLEFKFNPLRKFPVVNIEGEYHIPVLFLLLERIFSGVFWDINDFYWKHGESNNPFRDYFGKLFERYVQELIDFHFDKDKYSRIPSDNIGGYEIDNVISDEKNIFIFETLLGSTTQKLREKAEAESVENYCLRLADEIKKLYGKDRAVRTRFQYENLYPSVILFEDIPYANSFFRIKVDEILREKYDIKGYKYHIFSIGEFECLCNIMMGNSKSLGKIFKDKIKEHKFDIDRYFLSHMEVNIIGYSDGVENEEIMKKYVNTIQSEWMEYLYYDVNQKKSLKCNYLINKTHEFWKDMGL